MQRETHTARNLLAHFEYLYSTAKPSQSESDAHRVGYKRCAVRYTQAQNGQEERLTHTHCTRINLRDGSKSYVEFGEIDGTAFHAKWHGGFYTKVALLIVNRWNYIATLQSRIEYHYYLHTAEGAE